MDFYISATTDVGIKRDVNQDSLFVRKLETRTGDMVFAVLCDGMGGLKFGEVASSSIVNAFSDWMYTYLPNLSQAPLEDHVVRSHWESVITAQNSKIREYGWKHGCTTGSTVTALLLTQQRYFLLNIGDSRAYEIDGSVRQMTTDHTVIENEIRMGNMTEEQAMKSPMRSVLTRCVGVEESVSPDMFFGDVKRDAVYMLCSDGFRHALSKEEIQAKLYREVRGDAAQMKRQEEYLVELNKSRGETDNISVVTIYVGA